MRVFLAGGAVVASVATLLIYPLKAARAALGNCTLLPGSTIAVIRVEQDTMLPAAGGGSPLSASGVRPGPHDTLLATPTTLMPAGRVRLLRLDSTSRAAFGAAGITDDQPSAFVIAAPYRADCRPIRWTDSTSFVVPGELGFIRATLAPRERWIAGTPLLVIPDAWYYPYPRRRGLAFRAAEDAPLASADAMFGLSEVTDMPEFGTEESWSLALEQRRARALAWARANATAGDLEPVYSLLREAVLDPDWRAVERIPSRLRGTYRMDIEAGGKHVTWFFRTHDRPGYPWRGPVLQTTAELVASPHVAGYQLVGYASLARDTIPTDLAAKPRTMVWLHATDRPTAPGNDARRELAGAIEFTLASVPPEVWDDLEAFVPPVSPQDSIMRSRMRITVSRAEQQPRLPIRLRLRDAEVRADTLLTSRGRTVRLSLQRLDTLSARRPY